MSIPISGSKEMEGNPKVSSTQRIQDFCCLTGWTGCQVTDSMKISLLDCRLDVCRVHYQTGSPGEGHFIILLFSILLSKTDSAAPVGSSLPLTEWCFFWFMFRNTNRGCVGTHPVRSKLEGQDSMRLRVSSSSRGILQVREGLSLCVGCWRYIGGWVRKCKNFWKHLKPAPDLFEPVPAGGV